MKPKELRKSANRKPTIAEIPESILVGIFLRLPVKSIFSCRCVCKSWRNLTVDPDFAKLHFSISQVQFLLEPPDCEAPFLLAELDEVSCISNPDVDFRINSKSMIRCNSFSRHDMSTIDSNESTKTYASLCSWLNGFLCLQEKYYYVDKEDDWNPYHIYNPLTGEHIVVPLMETFTQMTGRIIPLPQALKRYSKPICFIGADPNTKEFKLLIFLRHEFLQRQRCLEAFILTVGSSSWRYIGPADSYLRLSSGNPFVNGARHWCCETKDFIISFDFEEEKFNPFPAPPCFSSISSYAVSRGNLGSLGGHLCFCYLPLGEGGCLDIWVMKEYANKESWTKIYVVDDIISAWMYQPIRYLKNGEILVLCSPSRVLSYNPTTKKCRYIQFCGSSKQKYFVHPLPYVPSFMRLLY